MKMSCFDFYEKVLPLFPKDTQIEYIFLEEDIITDYCKADTVESFGAITASLLDIYDFYITEIEPYDGGIIVYIEK